MAEPMTDPFDAMTKDELADFASVRGIEVDGRWSAQRTREAIRAEMAQDAANVTALSEAVATDMVTLEAPIVAPIVAPDSDLSSMAWEWALDFCADLERTTAVLDGDVLTVTISTRHGVTVESAAAPTVEAAFAAIKLRIMGA